MKQKSPNTLYTYWNELRAGRIAPRRLEIEPSRIAGVLCETFMLERVNALAYPYRLAGTRLCELFGSELRGSDFLTGWRESDHAVLAHELALVCDQGAVLTLEIEAKASPRYILQFEAILLPLLHTGSSIGRIIGAMSLCSPMPLLSAERPLLRRLMRHELIWPDGRPALRDRSTVSAPLPAPQPPAELSPMRARPRLRVLDGGRSFWKPGSR